MNQTDYSAIHPRTVADKSDKKNLQKALKMALAIESDAVRKGIGVFNTNRYAAVAKIPDYEDLKKQARKIKEHALSNLPDLINQVRNVIESHGGKVYLARTAHEANLYIKKVCLSHQTRMVVKSKSITSEEIGLNAVLEEEGIEIAETDLAEFILQVSGEQPSHGVVPAIHRSRERISELFRTHFQTDLPLETGEDLTRFARDILREKFLSADVGISGANVIAADTGTILLVESEGNIRLTTHLPAIHIAVAGIEKIIANYRDLGVFVELLAASGTGQTLTSYTNLLTPPLKLPILNCNGRDDRNREFHLVLIDNGRSELSEDPVLSEALYCIRCGACNNVCANFQNLGGHAFGGDCYSGGIGGAWTAATGGDIKKARFAELCTGCSRCIPNCPVLINIPKLNTEIKNRIMQTEGGPGRQKRFFAHFAALAGMVSPVAVVINPLMRLPFPKWLFRTFLGFAGERKIPTFSQPKFSSAFKKYRKSRPANKNSKHKIALFADVFIQYNHSEVGMAAVRALDKLGMDVALTPASDDGRAALSQGIIDLARKHAHHTIKILAKIIESGKDVVVLEPSVLAMFRQEYAYLLKDENGVEQIAGRCFDIIEYLNLKISQGEIALPSLRQNSKVFYHGHCQLKSIGLGEEVRTFLKSWGIEVVESTAECCGMAGSFGYKHEYYELSKKIGSHLADEIRQKGFNAETEIVLASGVSCREQIFDEMKREALHPIQLIDRMLPA